MYDPEPEPTQLAKTYWTPVPPDTVVGLMLKVALDVLLYQPAPEAVP